MPFNIGDKVYECGDRSLIFVVAGPPNELGRIPLLFEETGTLVSGSPYHTEDDLMLFDVEARQKAITEVSAKIAEAKDAFAKAFDILREANEAAMRHDYSLLELHLTEDVDFSALEDEINGGGWSSSSLYCYEG